MPRKQGQHDIAPVIRRAFIAAATRLGKGDSEAGLRDLLEKELEANPIPTLNAMAKFMPREHNITGTLEHEHTHTHESVSESVEWITGMLGDGQKKPTEKPDTH